MHIPLHRHPRDRRNRGMKDKRPSQRVFVWLPKPADLPPNVANTLFSSNTAISGYRIFRR